MKLYSLYAESEDTERELVGIFDTREKAEIFALFEVDARRYRTTIEEWNCC